MEYARRAGSVAIDLLAYEEAVRLYELALEALGPARPATARLRAELLLSLADAQGRAGDAPEAKSTFLRAADLARSARLPDVLARAAAGYGGRFVWTHAVADAQIVPLLEDGLSAVGETDRVLRIRLLSRAWPLRCATIPPASPASASVRRRSRSHAATAIRRRWPMRSPRQRPRCTRPRTPRGGWPAGPRSSRSPPRRETGNGASTDTSSASGPPGSWATRRAARRSSLR